MRKQPSGQLIVRTLRRSSTRGVLVAGSSVFPCALGRTGIRALKREGDGATPQGVYDLSQAFYRSDRCRRPRTGLPLRRLTPVDGWCDASDDRNYNRFVRHPYAASAEKMWRHDRLYDLVIVLDYNRCPRVRGRGSAIFVHVARPDFAPTEGCVALQPADLRRLLARLHRGTRVRIL